MKDILIIYGIHTEIVNVILILYKNTYSMVRSHDGHTPFFDIPIGIVYWSTRTYMEINLLKLYVSTIY